MRKTCVLILISFFLCLLPDVWSALTTQEQEQKVEEKAVVQTEILPRRSSYSPGGRRDPFKDLLGGIETKSGTSVEGLPELLIEDIRLFGIVKVKGIMKAIISGPQGFPYSIKVGDEFADGYVLSIDANQVVFRKIRERGLPLLKPQDIVKEFIIEES